MASVVAETKVKAKATGPGTLINDVVIKIATLNGTGSNSANLILTHAIFHMGIPVSSKNRFPSNIEGLPTWFTIRANHHGWLAHRVETDILVALNAQSFEEDVERLEPGAILVMSEAMKHELKRADLTVYYVPFSTLVKEVSLDTRLRKKLSNLIYVGVVAWILDVDLEEIDKAIERQFKTKPAAAALNMKAAETAYRWAEENLSPQTQFKLERSNDTKNKLLVEGNDAAALGLLFGGVSVLAWYPITPSSSVCETLARYLHEYRRDEETGKATFAVVQAEDEIASIGIVLGAGWAGARACTATSGPGLSLMAEMAGLAYFAEVPAVIIDVMRMGPSTGLPTRTGQSDVLSAYYLSHGDCKHVMLIPGNMKECYEFSMQALDLAECLQTLVIVLSDLDLGMNRWMSDPFDPPSKPLNRGKVLTEKDTEKLKNFERYRDVDGDGVTFRTLPGTDHPNAAYFTRGTGHTPQAGYSEKATNWKANMDRLARKFKTARDMVPPPVVDTVKDTSIGIIAYGSSDLAVREARHFLEERHGIRTAYLRLRALPVNGEVIEFLDEYDRVYVVDQNRDAQMASILRAEFPRFGPKLRSVLHYDGRPVDAETIVADIAEQEQSKGPAQ